MLIEYEVRYKVRDKLGLEFGSGNFVIEP